MGGAALPIIAGAGLIGSIYEGEQNRKAANSASDAQIAASREASALADPFRGERGYYAGELKKLMTDPNYVLESPVYKAEMESGMSAVERSMGAKGLLKSGGRLTALQDYGSGLTGNLFFQYANLLSGLSGTSANPAAGASILSQGATNAANTRLAGETNATNLYTQAIGQAGFLGYTLDKQYPNLFSSGGVPGTTSSGSKSGGTFSGLEGSNTSYSNMVYNPNPALPTSIVMANPNLSFGGTFSGLPGSNTRIAY